jgi:hypothetical protein
MTTSGKFVEFGVLYLDKLLSQGKTLPSVLFIFSTLSFMDLAIPVVINLHGCPTCSGI